MPKLIESTVEENRRTRYAALLESAVAIALEDGSSALTITAVAKRAGISRAGVYEYFSSKEDMVADLIVDEVKIWAQLLSSATALVASPEEKIKAWLESALGYVQSGRHKLARELSSISLPDEKVSEVRTAHYQLLKPLVDALTQYGVNDPMRTAMYINGLVEVATRRIDSGRMSEGECDFVIALALQLISK